MTKSNTFKKLITASIVMSFTSQAASLEANSLRLIPVSNTIETIKIEKALPIGTIKKFNESIKDLDFNKAALEAQQYVRSEKQIKQDILKILFPVITSTMSLKEFPEGTNFLAHKNNVPPVAVVGSDDFSLNWLDKNAQKIKKLGAVIMLVQAETPEQYKKVLSYGGGTEVYPFNGELLTEATGLSFYPAIIMPNGFYQ